MTGQKSFQILLGVIVPLAMIAIILASDVIEGPKTAYVGVLAAVPLFSAIFGTPAATIFIAFATWISAFVFGHVASDGNTRSQTVRLVIIAIFGVVAVLAANLRVRRDRQFTEALKAAAEAEVIRTQAYTDPLTGLLNRRGVLSRIEHDQDGARTIALVDVDHLKSINDDHGHLIGDAFIIGVGARISGGLSRDDIVGRWGGDEFLIVLDLAGDDAVRVMQRVFDHVTSESLSTRAGMIPLGICMGVAGWPQGEEIDVVLARADQALYTAKQDGRSRLVVSGRTSETSQG
jgi:diguanylate cyclase (GGDEF)-like protein